ncbi:MAG: SGNH/GDSL hydrolase family protein, partial [Roseburia sp.]|nr:SGNH/GDSL hydrolase family protein [Roseburia sp.]
MNKDAAKIFSRIILSDRTIRIKLLGDSITHGVGGTGFEQNGEPIVTGWARNPNGYCWANQFKAYLESQFNCVVINNGCTGTTIQFILDHFDELVDKEDDIILCTIGTNNRHQHFHESPRHTRREHMELFYQDIFTLHKRLKDAGKDVIFVANIPASAENEKDGEDYYRLFHMNDVQDIYVKASIACEFPLICLYTLFLEYCEQKNIAIDSLLADGLHPNDAGYDVMFALLMDELGIARKVPGS